MYYSVKQVYQYFNKNIGIHKIRSMMQTGEIPSTIISNKLVTTEKQINNYINKKNAEMEIIAYKMQSI